eukprot:6729282-Prymnesium_polylepis.1
MWSIWIEHVLCIAIITCVQRDASFGRVGRACGDRGPRCAARRIAGGGMRASWKIDHAGCPYSPEIVIKFRARLCSSRASIACVKSRNIYVSHQYDMNRTVRIMSASTIMSPIRRRGSCRSV